jgi:hypothetical protein
VGVEFNCEVDSNAKRAVAFNNSGKFDAVGKEAELEGIPEKLVRLRLERVLEELETIGSCSAKAEFEPQA